MNARLGLNLGLIGLCAILGLLVVYEPGLEAPQPLPRLTAIEGPAVQAITITRKEGDAIVLAKEGDRWSMRAPYAVPANSGRMQSILGFLAAKSGASFPAQGQALQRYGLADPKVRMEVGGERFAFGDTDPLDGKRYVLYKDRVHLAADGWYDELLGDAGDFVSPRLVEEGRDLIAIELPGMTVERRDGAWVLHPEDAAVKADDLARLAEDWRSAQALTVRKRREGTAQGSITLEQKDAGALRFELLARDPDLVLGRADLGLEYRLGGEMAQRLLRPARTEEQARQEIPEESGALAQDPPISP